MEHARAIRCASALVPVVAWTVAGTATAQPVQLVAQSRTVEATSTAWVNLWDESQNPFFPDFHQPIFQQPFAATDQSAAPDFLPWISSAQTQNPAVPFLPPVAGMTLASHDSLVQPPLLEASGGVEFVTDSYIMTIAQVQQLDALLNPPVPYFFGTVDDSEVAQSEYVVTFDVLASTHYTLTGSLLSITAPPPPGSLPGDIRMTGFVELAESGGAVVHRIEIDCFISCLPADPLDESGTLAPGTYVLTAHIDGSAFGYCYDAGTLTCFMPSGEGSFSVQLALGAAALPGLGGVAALGLTVLLGTIGVIRVAPAQSPLDSPEALR